MVHLLFGRTHIMSSFEDDDLKAGKGCYKSERVGRHCGRPARSCHIRFSSLQVGYNPQARASIDYIAGLGKYRHRDDLECVIGNPDDLKSAVTAIEVGAVV